MADVTWIPNRTREVALDAAVALGAFRKAWDAAVERERAERFRRCPLLDPRRSR